MIIFRSVSRGNAVGKAKWALWLRKQEVDVRLAKWLVEKHKQNETSALTSSYKYMIGYPTHLF